LKITEWGLLRVVLESLSRRGLVWYIGRVKKSNSMKYLKMIRQAKGAA
jgi:hypothetical protein